MTDFRGAREGESLEERVCRLEDREAIRNLKHQYARYCDNGYDADGMVGLFTEDAIWESNAFGTYHGSDEIYGFISRIGDEIVWALHFMCNPIIDVAADGRSARGTWLLIEPATMVGVGRRSSQDAVIVTANYEDTFVKRDGEWKFKYVKASFQQVSNLDQGWVRQPFRG